MEIVDRSDDDIRQEMEDDNGWKVVRYKRRAKKEAKCAMPSASPSRLPKASGAKIISQVNRASKMPKLPMGDYKIVIRPRGGLQLSQLSLLHLGQAIYEAAGIRYDEPEADTICPDNFQNIIVVSTPNQDYADKYQCIKTIKFNGKEYEVGAYETAPDVTAKGVIRGVPVEVSPRDITAAIITPRNRTAIAAKRLENTTTVIILFEGYKVPSYVNYGGVLTRCSLYRKQVDFCKQCNRLGHRSDVCPKPEDKLCAGDAARPTRNKITHVSLGASCAGWTTTRPPKPVKPSSRNHI
ncbi:hypothetical protein HPB49_012609 [Dermacentor silvarum]|uniref:Uncharacterized protein n=1 Tax=Dermacentor silvarum TaxID=543639 RepID=A0ACB8C9A8_DERSI|nr:hypothetical protein HPB49_012609 [Dermacentor silvarum]